MTTGTAGQQIGGVAGNQPVIGEFVQDILRPNGDTNFMGCNPAIGYDRNALGCDVGFTCPTNFGAAAGTKPATWGHSAVALVPPDKVTIAAGEFTKDDAAGTHTIGGNIPAGGYGWAVLI